MGLFSSSTKLKLFATAWTAHATAVMVVLFITVVGSALILARAAGVYISHEAETGKAANGAFAKTDTTASGGQAINFTEGTPDPIAHSPLPFGPFHTPKPVITIDASQAPEFKPWLEQVMKPLLEQWYPYLGDYFAYPSYTPPSSFTIMADPNYKGVAETRSGTVIVFRPSYFHGRLSDAPGAFLHEATHVAQWSGGGNLPGWIVEGEADYTREHLYNDRAPRAAYANETYLNGYSPGANLLYYTQTRYDTSIIQEVNARGAAKAYSNNFFVEKTGRTIAQLWTELTGQAISNPGPITGIGGKCLDDPNYATDNGTRIKVQTCNGFSAEDWILAGVSSRADARYIMGNGYKCLDVAASGTADGTPVQYYTCNLTNAQLWIPQSNGALINVNATKCLQTVGGSSVDGSLLEIATCTGSAAQLWRIPT